MTGASELDTRGPLRQTPRGLLLYVRATPRASRNTITGLVQLADGTQALAVKVTAVAEQGKANEAVIEVLASAMHIAKSALTLTSGGTSRNKVFRVEAKSEDINAWLAEVKQAKS